MLVLAVFILALGIGSYYLVPKFMSMIPQKPQITVEELNKKADDIVKEFNQYLYDKHMEKDWYRTVSKSEVNVNSKGEALVKIFSKDFVNNGNEEVILTDSLSFFNSQILAKYQLKSVKIQVHSPDNQLLAEKVFPYSAKK